MGAEANPKNIFCDSSIEFIQIVSQILPVKEKNHFSAQVRHKLLKNDSTEKFDD